MGKQVSPYQQTHLEALGNTYMVLGFRREIIKGDNVPVRKKF